MCFPNMSHTKEGERYSAKCAHAWESARLPPWTVNSNRRRWPFPMVRPGGPPSNDRLSQKRSIYIQSLRAPHALGGKSECGPRGMIMHQKTTLLIFSPETSYVQKPSKTKYQVGSFSCLHLLFPKKITPLKILSLQR